MDLKFRFNSLAALTLTVLYNEFFSFTKHDPAVSAIMPFGDDPYDSVASVALIVSILLTVLALIRAFRPYGQGGAPALSKLFLGRAQMAIANVADKAAGYGMPGMMCDGMDPIATYAEVKAGLDRARTGGGPTLIEAKCFRYLSHSTDDDDRAYRDRSDIVEARKRDPLPAFERVLVDAGVLDAAGAEALRTEVLRETNAATDAAEALPYPAADELYTHVYAGAYEPWQ